MSLHFSNNKFTQTHYVLTADKKYKIYLKTNFKHK